MPEENPYRLPRNVIPHRYELTLTPDLAKASFAGEERIEIEVVESTQTIRLNAIELDILSAELSNANGDIISGVVSADEDSEVATISLDSQATAGEWILHLTFTGTLNDKLRGFYRSTFRDDNGNEHVIATTQFEATDARRAFPCWDEPDFKAIFSVTLIFDENLAAFSNGAVEENDSLGNGKRQVKFADTMKMSTYLVAFIVGPLVETEVIDVDGTPLRVACVPGREHLARFALEAGAGALRFFTKYFGIPYPGGKLDLISLPDFAFGAMENLGCVTFRETALLVDTGRASRVEIERVADVVGHEIAHMWFGDLVTMKWWNGIWLNEAFATFMEVSFVDQFKPDWQRWVSFGLSKAAAMGIDSLTSTRPIEFQVTRPEEASGMFDLLTYEKGCAVLRMLEQHMGPDVFARGVSLYLDTHAYGNAETTDLWDGLEQSSGEPIRAMMDTWIFQGGHPVVEATLSEDKTKLVLTQQRFRYLDESNEESPLWHIPVGIRVQTKDRQQSIKTVITGRTTTVALPTDTEWLTINEHSNGFFRVSYSPEILGQLLDHLADLEPIERFTLITDTWAACLSGRSSLPDTFALIEKLSKDTDPNVWNALLSPISLVDKMVNETQRPKFIEFVRHISTPLFNQLGWDVQPGESEQIATVRGIVIGILGGIGEDENIRSEAIRRYDAYKTNPNAIDPNLVGAVEGILAATNDPTHYETLWTTFKNDASTPQDQVRALGALASFKNETLIHRTLTAILDNEVRSQDAPYTIRIMLARRQSGLLVWKWCEEHWTTLTERFPDNSIVRMLDGVSAQVEPSLSADVQNFMAAHPVPQAQKSVDQTCERLRVNAAFNLRNQTMIDQLFS